jgi:hypothetical protein
MKLKNQAIRSISTHELKELADLAYTKGLQNAAAKQDVLRPGVAGSADDRIEEAFNNLQASGKPVTAARLAKLAKTNFNTAQNWLENNQDILDRPADKESSVRGVGSQREKKGQDRDALSAAPIWNLKDRADALREKERARQLAEAELARKNQTGNIFERLAKLVLPKNRSQTESPQKQADRDIHVAAKQTVGETIVGAVGLNDVLKELQRRGVTYKPPLDENGVLHIDESDLVPGNDTEHARLRPGIAKYLHDHEDQIAGIKVNTTKPVDLGSVNIPNGFVESVGPVRANYFNLKELHTVGDVTVEEFIRAGEIQGRGNITARDILTSECTVYGNINCAESLKFVCGSTDSKQLMTGDVHCGHLSSDDDRQVEVGGSLSVRGNCNVPRLSARDLSVGWELQGTKDLYVAAKANITRLSRTIDSEAELRGDALQEYVDQLRDMRKEQLEEEVLEKIQSATAQTSDEGVQTIEWTAAEMETNAYKEYVSGEKPVEPVAAKQSHGASY